MTAINPFHFPEVCHLGQRIAKALFADNGPLTPADRRTFKNEIEEAVCAYVLKPDNVFLNPWSDGEHEYDSLAVIEITLRKTGKAERIAELFHRTMPYPLLLIFHKEEPRMNTNEHKYENEEKNNLCPLVSIGGSMVLFSMAEKRISRDGREQVVLERTVNTPWQPESALNEFVTEANFAKFRKTTFRDLYFHYLNLLEALCAAAVTGELHTDGIAPDVRRKVLAQLHSLDLELASIKAQAKQEKELSKQVELNLKAKTLEQIIAQRIAMLKRLKNAPINEKTDMNKTEKSEI